MEETEFFDYESACALVDHMWSHFEESSEMSAQAIASIEQVHSVARDHLTNIGCDPDDPKQVRAALCGALLVVTIQAQMTPIVGGVVVLARALADFETTQTVTLSDWTDVVQKLSITRSSRTSSFFRSLVEAIQRFIDVLEISD